MGAEAGTPGHSLSWHVWLGTLICIVPATVLVTLRFYARVMSRAGLKEDDWLILAALLFAWAMAALRFYGIVKDGLGYHAYTLSDAQVVDYQKSFLAVQICYFFASVLTKSSILLLYRRVFGVYKKFLMAVWVALFLVACYFIICLLISIFGCHPVSLFWNKNQDGYCLDEVSFFRWNGVTNLLLDVLILALPLPMVWNLQLKFKQKLALSSIFLLGGFACLASIFRIAQFQKSKQSDPTFTTVDSGMWSSVEQTIAIICACLPTLRPLLRSRSWGSSAENRPGAGTVPYYSSGYELGSGTRSNARQSRMQRSQARDPWEKEAESESVVGFAMEGSKNNMAVISHDDKSDEDVSMSSNRPPMTGIMQTREIRQDVASLKRGR